MPTEEEKVLELQSKRLVLRFIDELWNKRNLDIVDELCHPEYVGEIAGVPDIVQGREALKQLIATYHAAFEVNATFRSVFIIVEDQGDNAAVMVVVYRDYLLRHKGEFQGIPPTGKEVRIRSNNIYAIVHGPDQIIHQVVQFDTRSLRQKLRGGAISTPV
jgi:predicted ester cyclase